MDKATGAPKPLRILTIEDDRSFANELKKSFEGAFHIEIACDAQSGMTSIAKQIPDLILLDVGLPEIDGIQLLKIIKKRYPDLPVVMLTGSKDPDQIVQAMKAGASNYVVKEIDDFRDILNFKINEVMRNVNLSKEITRLRAENIAHTEANKKLAKKIVLDNEKYNIIGNSPVVLKLKSQILKLKGSSSYVLITGENGTGKELIARQLNLQENDPARPFVAINCAAIPSNIIESELFGYVKGSFTGASNDKEGLFVAADGGDIFLDEIGELEYGLQSKLLRVLQESTITPVGSTKSIPINVRVIAATNRDLPREVAEKRFREDLYYRLDQIALNAPALRDRSDDILVLAKFFLSRQISGAKFSQQAEMALLMHDWPGNIRQLEHSIKRAGMTIDGTGRHLIEACDLQLTDTHRYADRKLEVPANLIPASESDLTPEAYEKFQLAILRMYWEKGLKLVNEDQEAFYTKLNVSRAVYYRQKRAMGLT